MKISELKYKPKELPCCKDCPNRSKLMRDCLEPFCFDILIHNDLVDKGGKSND